MSDLTKIKSLAISAKRGVSAMRAYRNMRRFRRDDEGAMTALTLFVLILFLVMGGIGIDTMRHEMERAKLQTVLDAAVLAGAGSSNNDEAKAIVEDYFDKMGMSEYLGEFAEGDINITLNTSKVTARASKEIDTYLMKLSGVKTLSTAAASTAEMRVPKLEISLVLDVSGSMGSNNKLTNLKVAAKDFVTTMLNNADPGDTVISIVPFSWNVAPGPDIFEALTVNQSQDFSTCLRFSDNDYNSAAIDPNQTYDQQIYTAVYGSFDSSGVDGGWRSCFNDEYAEILPYSIDETALHAQIDSLQADGNTSGQLGIKWGAALLDPAFRPVSASLRTNGVIDASLNNVPSSYTEAETLKVIVMMGDGKNTTSYFFDDTGAYDPATGLLMGNYRGPDSDLFKVTAEEFQYARHKYKNKISYDQSKCGKKRWVCEYGIEESYYLRDAPDDQYYSINDDEWISSDDFDDLENTLQGYEGTEQFTWEQAWARMSPDYYRDITGNSAPWNDYVGSSKQNGSDKNARMRNVCSAAKANNVVIYTIGFEVSQGGTAETELKDCATSNSHYYAVEGISITDAFNSIASNVQNLRLTQ